MDQHKADTKHVDDIDVQKNDFVITPDAREAYGPAGIAGIFGNSYVALCAAFSAMGGLLFGYDQGVVSVTLTMDDFLERFHQIAPESGGASFNKGLLTAMIELGALFGALNTGWIADKYSRKYCIVIAVVVFVIGSALQTASINYDMLIVARLIGGIGIGSLSAVAPMYISEISPPEIRGTLLVLEEFSIIVGIVVAFWITYGTRYMSTEWSWRLPFLLQILPGLVLGVGIVFLPFSPRWLGSKGRDEEALHALTQLRRLPATDPRVQQEWFDIRAEARLVNEISKERHPDLQDGSRTSRMKLELASWADLFKKGCLRRTHVGVGIMFMQQFVGINALIYYSPTLFETMGLNSSMQLIMSGVLNIMQLVGCSTSIWTMDRFGRRTLLLWGSFFMAASHIIISGLVGEGQKNWDANGGMGWAAVAFLLIYMVAFGASWGPVPWALPSEIFPSSLRAKGVALSTCSNWLNNFIIGLVTPPLISGTNNYGAYIFFAAFCVFSGIWVFFCVPETNGRSLEEMDHVFRDAGGNEEEEIRKLRIERELAASTQASAVA
ncbi:general substrate transporter [Aureobasidium pullulans EXF-150]|uniref:General substrate transporter n=1 Tax=Aureobasidium pullulans EXF-150 TaxID=1043002 RepID=A0A074X604_AURPU|nr:general substrate transporter [Aureobasidium pullulans EXF-150]KEQ80945.1 general substrate transporter [Aureobasidium pullulans EXF-150]